MQGFPHRPSWVEAVEPLVDASDLTNSSSSLLLVLWVRDRFFAVTFGYANALLRDELLEPEFGLRVAANAADPEVTTFDELVARAEWHVDAASQTSVEGEGQHPASVQATQEDDPWQTSDDPW